MTKVYQYSFTLCLVVVLLAIILFKKVSEVQIVQSILFDRDNLTKIKEAIILSDEKLLWRETIFKRNNRMYNYGAEKITERNVKSFIIQLNDIIRAHKNKTYRIVVFEPFHGMLTKDASIVNMAKCVYKNCHVTISKDTSKSDAVIIQGSRPTRPLPVRVSQKQVFVFASLETPLYLSFVNLSRSEWNRFYNWSMTYRRDADIPYVYGMIVPKVIPVGSVVTNMQLSNAMFQEKWFSDYETDIFENPVGTSNKNYSEIFRRKNVTAAWLVSHCDTASKREEYVEVMKRIIDVDIFGRCNGRLCQRDYKTCDEILISKTKFYLAFENSICSDYITEKAFKWFERDIIIVARGSRSYKNFLPVGTYVDADDFRSANELALYLKGLSSNETEYIKFLKRKDMYRVISRNLMTQVAYCNLCRKLNNLKSHEGQFDMQRSWTGTACVERNKIII